MKNKIIYLNQLFSIDCGFLLIDHHCAENLRWTTKLWIWDLKTIMDPSSSLRIIQPAFDISLRPSPFIRFERFGEVIITHHVIIYLIH
jgi:hypothetical protein